MKIGIKPMQIEVVQVDRIFVSFTDNYVADSYQKKGRYSFTMCKVVSLSVEEV